MKVPDPARSCAVDPDGHARRVLEFDKVLASIAAEARTAGGVARVLALLPASDPEIVRASQATVGEVRLALEEGSAPWPLETAEDARELLQEARVPGARLDAASLGRVATTLEAAGRLRRALDACADRCPRVRALAAGLGDHTALVAAVRAVVDERGEMRENASPLLRRLRREIQEQREELLSRLESVMRASGASPDQYVTQRSDRYVIPVRADSTGSVRGIVHDRSGSGATLFVEPLEVLDANNELQRRRDAEAREVRRILEELTGRIAAESEAAAASLDAIEQVDAVQAAAVWGRALDAAAPRIGPRPRLQGARHPLLEIQLRAQERASVPLDLELGEARVLVLTGPNAGGKTVALKTIGLLALMHQAGVPVPARSESELPVFERIFADIGDEQSIEAAESTFSSHLKHVLELVRAAGPRTLALVDEFMAGTDPDEGAALAQVVLRRLAACGTTTFVTTHLAALKLFAHTEPGLANAGMAFDSESRTPLYRLQPGVPGSSNALATAARLGLDPELLEEARAARGAAAGRLEAALEALEAERASLALQRENAAASERETRRIREDYAVLHAQLTAKRRTALADARREAEDLVTGAKARIEAAVRELRAAQASPESIRAAHQEVQALRDTVAALGADAESVDPAAQPEGPGAPQPGDRVWVRALGREGILDQVESGGRAQVRFGNLTLNVAAADLQRVSGSAAQPAEPLARTLPGGYTAPEAPPISSRLDLRGLERQPALEAVEVFLDRMVLQGTNRGEIVHGKGTGVLRKAVQEFLARHPDVAEFRLGAHDEGGSGVTIVQLRG